MQAFAVKVLIADKGSGWEVHVIKAMVGDVFPKIIIAFLRVAVNLINSDTQFQTVASGKTGNELYSIALVRDLWVFGRTPFDRSCETDVSVLSWQEIRSWVICTARMPRAWQSRHYTPTACMSEWQIRLKDRQRVCTRVILPPRIYPYDPRSCEWALSGNWSSYL